MVVARFATSVLSIQTASAMLLVGKRLTLCLLAAGWLCAGVPALDTVYRLPPPLSSVSVVAGWHVTSAMCIWAALRVHLMVGRSSAADASYGMAWHQLFWAILPLGCKHSNTVSPTWWCVRFPAVELAFRQPQVWR